MTKHRAWVVAGVVVVLAVTACLPLVCDAYVWLAYEDAQLMESEIRRATPVGDTYVIPSFPQRPAKKLRWPWFPGPLYVFAKVCYRCGNDEHQWCNGDESSVFKLQGPPAELEFEEHYTCTCPDPSHTDKP